MTSVPEDEDEDHDQIEEEEEDIQSFSAAERRSKSKQRKNATDVRYISLKPFFKKERKRQQQKSHFEAESADIESNGAAPDDLDNQDDDDDEYVKASPVPLPDASTCKSILHRFGYNNQLRTRHVSSPCTGKSLSEALFFAEHGENMLCTKIVLNLKQFLFTP